MASRHIMTCDWCKANITDGPCGRVRLERLNNRHEIVNTIMLDACLVCFEKLHPTLQRAFGPGTPMVHPVPPPPTDATIEQGDNYVHPMHRLIRGEL